MGIPNVAVNYVAVFGAAVVSIIIGSLWYSPLLFGNAWMKSAGVSAKDINKAKKKGMGKIYLSAFIASLLMAFILANFARFVTSNSFVDGVGLGFWIWLGFVAPILLGSVLWEGKPFNFYAINSLYWLVNLMIAGGIVSVWR